MTWIEALKEWNARHGGKWCIPKKGSKEHSEVLAIQHENAPTTGGNKPNKRAGYVKLLVAKTQGKTPDDYSSDKNARPKKGARRINMSKLANASVISENLLHTYGTATQKKQLEKAKEHHKVKAAVAKNNQSFVNAGFKAVHPSSTTLKTSAPLPTFNAHSLKELSKKPAAAPRKAKPAAHGTQTSIASYMKPKGSGKVRADRYSKPTTLESLYDFARYAINPVATSIRDYKHLRDPNLKERTWAEYFQGKGMEPPMHEDLARVLIGLANGSHGYEGDGKPRKTKKEAEISEETKKHYEETDFAKRQQLGQFYTPHNLVNKCFETLGLDSSARCLEPTYGSGQFLDGLLSHGFTNITGVEFDKETYDRTLAKYTAKGVNCINGDYLLQEFPQKFDLVIGNPPYFLMKGSKNPAKDRSPNPTVIAKYKEYIKGVPDIYGLCTVKGIMDLADGGVLSYVIPTSILTAASFQKVRDYIHKTCTIERVEPHEQRDEFEGANVKVMIFQLRKTDEPTMAFCKYSGSNILFTPEEGAAAEASEGTNRMGDLVAIHGGTTSIDQLTEAEKALLSGTRTETTLPIIYGENITNSGLTIDKKLKGTRQQYISNTYRPTRQVEAPFLTFNRSVSTGKAKQEGTAIKCCIVTEGTYYIENHVYSAKGTPENLERVRNFLISPEHQRLFLKDVNSLSIPISLLNEISVPLSVDHTATNEVIYPEAADEGHDSGNTIEYV
jgi:tRNA1(Val) A37 N6-methylase TrmN6